MFHRRTKRQFTNGRVGVAILRSNWWIDFFRNCPAPSKHNCCVGLQWKHEKNERQSVVPAADQGPRQSDDGKDAKQVDDAVVKFFTLTIIWLNKNWLITKASQKTVSTFYRYRLECSHNVWQSALSESSPRFFCLFRCWLIEIPKGTEKKMRIWSCCGVERRENRIEMRGKWSIDEVELTQFSSAVKILTSAARQDIK